MCENAEIIKNEIIEIIDSAGAYVLTTACMDRHWEAHETGMEGWRREGIRRGRGEPDLRHLRWTALAASFPTWPG